MLNLLNGFIQLTQDVKLNHSIGYMLDWLLPPSHASNALSFKMCLAFDKFYFGLLKGLLYKHSFQNFSFYIQLLAVKRFSRYCKR